MDYKFFLLVQLSEKFISFIIKSNLSTIRLACRHVFIIATDEFVSKKNISNLVVVYN